MIQWFFSWAAISVLLIANNNDTKLAFEASEGTLISVDVSPNGRTIAFDLLGHIYLMPINGGKAEAVTKGKSWNMFPRFSPDGEKILFTSDRSGSDDLWVQELKTGQMKNISKKTDYSIDRKLVEFIEWFATYNMVPIGLALKMVIGGNDKYISLCRYHWKSQMNKI